MSSTDLEALVVCGLALVTCPFLIALSLESSWGPYDKMTPEKQAAVNAMIGIFTIAIGLRFAFIVNPEAML
jgi:hypothetical protein